MKPNAAKDPLVEILERHLYRSSTEDLPTAKTIEAVIADYLLFLDAQGAHVPAPVRPVFVEDLKEEIRELMSKRTYEAIDEEKNQGFVRVTPRKIT